MSWFNKQFGNMETSFGERTKSTKGNKGTSFWGKRLFDFNNNDKEPTILERTKLLKSVRNFVKILTGKDIPVRYSSEGEDKSFTDSKTITISGNVSKEFDATCGLAMHEGTHIVLTDFEILHQIMDEKQRKQLLDKKYLNYIGLIKDLLNIIEDRRIDDWQYKESPGYKIYYQEMYKKYFESDKINELINNKFVVCEETKQKIDLTEETVQNYMFYVINITNPKVKMNELKGLPEIWKLVDIKNIDRLGDNKKGTKKALGVALKIFDIIEKYVTKEDMKKNEGDKSKDNEPIEYDGPLKDLKAGNGKGGKPVKIGPNALKELQDLLKKQKDFLKSLVKKQKVDSETNNKINVLIESDTEEIEIKKQQDRESNDGEHKVITVNNITMNTIQSNIYKIFNYYNSYQDENVNRGIMLGTMLGKKLQTRQEERTLITPRLNIGKIDKRRLSNCGYGSDDIFFTKTTDKYGDISVHISLDLSGSMTGNKWTNTMISAIAIAKAASMTKGIRIQISLRYSDGINGSEACEQAIVINFYDSKIDSPNKLKWFKYVSPHGCTPEGLCYEALMTKIMKPLLNKNSLFINYSDGYPGMCTMGTQEGIIITKQAVNKIRNSGVEILSFFINENGLDDMNSFKEMYGKGTTNINVTSLIPLAKELNKKFLQMGKLN